MQGTGHLTRQEVVDVLLSVIPDDQPDYGNQWETMCPNADCPSVSKAKKKLYINEEKNGRGICFVCNTRYTLPHFIECKLGLSPSQARAYVYGDTLTRVSRITSTSALVPLSTFHDTTTSPPPLHPAIAIPRYLIQAHDHPYLQSRKAPIPPEVSDKMGLLYDPVGRWKGRIVLPLCTDRGKVVGLAARATWENPKRKTLFTEGYPKRFYVSNAQTWSQTDADYIILVEGEFGDVSSVLRIDDNVGASMGCALTAHQVEYLADRGIRRVFLFWDKTVPTEKWEEVRKLLDKYVLSMYCTHIPGHWDEEDPGDFRDPEKLRYVLRQSKKVTSIGDIYEYRR